LLYRPKGHLSPFAGRLGVHGQVAAESRIGPYDAVIGQGFAILGWNHDPREHLPADVVRRLEALGANFVTIRSEPSPEEAPSNTVTDINGKYEQFFTSNGLSAVVIRPDFYIYGAARGASDLQDIVLLLLSDLSIQPEADQGNNELSLEPALMRAV
jgi:hypothetical protein